jgi:hypothetical protein
MPGPCTTRPDLCSIRAAQQTESADPLSGAIPVEEEPVPGRPRHASGHLNRQRGTAGACMVTSHRGQRMEAGR